MKMSTKYTVALQILCICDIYKDNKITSNFISEKTGADSSTIRYVMLDLKKKKYIDSKPGPGGTSLNVPLSSISLFDVYDIVAEPEDSMLKFYELPKDSEYIDIIIKDVINSHFETYKFEILAQMKATTLADICNEIRRTLNN